MADVLALSWDRRRLSGVEFSSSASGPRILNGFSATMPEQGPTANWLRDTLRKHGIGAKHVVLAMPREDVVLRLLELPDVPEEELPTLVRFQAAARSAQSIDQLLLDYLPLPRREGVPQREVWLASTPLTTVDPIRALLSEAGLDLVQLTLSSCSLVELVARTEAKQTVDPQNATLVVLREGARMELAVFCQNQLLAAHSVRWSSVSDIPPVNKMLSEVSRLLVQVQGWLPDRTLQHAYIIGEDADVAELTEAVSQRWECSARRLNPWHDAGISVGNTDLEGPESEYAIVAGLALIQSSGLTPKLDLLHPRQPPPKRDPRKPYIAAAAAAGLLFISFASAIVQQYLASYDRAIEKKRAEEEELIRWIGSRKQIETSTKSIEEWQSRNVNQLNQLTELYQMMHGTGRIVIGDYRFNIASGNVLATLKVVGKSRDRKDYERLAQSLDDLPHFKVPSSGEQKSGDATYSSRFDFNMEIVPGKKKSTSPTKTDTNAVKPNTGVSQ